MQGITMKDVFSLLTTTYFMLSDFQAIISYSKAFNPNINPNSCSEFPDDIVQDSFSPSFQC